MVGVLVCSTTNNSANLLSILVVGVLRTIAVEGRFNLCLITARWQFDCWDLIGIAGLIGRLFLILFVDVNNLSMKFMRSFYVIEPSHIYTIFSLQVWLHVASIQGFR